MALMRVAALAPDAILLPADFDEHRRYSRLFMSAVADIAPQIEDRGIDDVMSHPLYLSGNDCRAGTYGWGAELSPALRATVSAVGVERRGVWAPRIFLHLPEIGNAVDAALDHAAVWVDLP